MGQLVVLSWNNVFVAFQSSGDLMIPNGYGVDIKKILFMKENIELQPLDVHMEEIPMSGADHTTLIG